MNVRLLNLAFMITLLAVLVCSKTSVADDGQISVTGNGSVIITPDHYQLTMAFEERGAIVSKLNQNIQHQLSAVIEFLKKQGIREEHMQSMQINLQPWIEHNREGSQHKGFLISRQLRIIDNRIDRFDEIIDGVLQRGVNRIEAFELRSSGYDLAYKEALVKALQDANDTAERMAKSMGLKIKTLVSIAPSADFRGATPRMLMSSEKSLALPGQESVSASVNVVFSVE